MACSAWACAVTSGPTSEGWFYSGEVHVIGTLVFLFMHWRELTKPHGEMKGECVSPESVISCTRPPACRARSSRSPSLVIGRCCPLTCVEEEAPDCGSCVWLRLSERNGSKSNSPPGMVRCLPPFPVSSTLQPGCCSHLFPRFGSTKHESSGTPRPLAPRRRLGYTCLSTGAVNRCIHHGRVSGPAL